MVPGEGAKFRTGSSALIRHSMACPFSGKYRFPWIFSPAAIAICSRTRSVSSTSSVTGCSTWIRVFISMK